MPRTPEQNREYMRGYRARKRVVLESDAMGVIANVHQKMRDLRRERDSLIEDVRIWEERAHVAQAQTEAMKASLSPLLEEVRHLKEELAKRPPADVRWIDESDRRHMERDPSFNPFSSRPFTPVPKKGS